MQRIAIILLNFNITNEWKNLFEKFFLVYLGIKASNRKANIIISDPWPRKLTKSWLFKRRKFQKKPKTYKCNINL